MSKNDKIVYGVRPVEELLLAGLPVKKVYFETDKTDTKFAPLRDRCLELQIPFEEKSARFLDKLCENTHHQGVMAFYIPLERQICFENPGYQPRTGWNLCLYLDGIQDPQNFGAIVRSAEFFGADQVFYPEHGNAPFTPVAQKTSAGGGIHNPPYKISSVSTLFEKVNTRNITVVGTDPYEGTSIEEMDFRRDLLLVIGSEGSGMNAKIRNYCHEWVKIPRIGKVESLNASVSAGILLYQALINRGMQATANNDPNDHL